MRTTKRSVGTTKKAARHPFRHPSFFFPERERLFRQAVPGVDRSFPTSWFHLVLSFGIKDKRDG